VDVPGSTAQTAEAWKAASERLERLSDLLSKLPDAQVAHHLLRACGDGCRVNHLLRATKSYAVQEQVMECHETVLSSFMDLMGATLTPPQRLQATLPIRVGGCGIKGIAQLQPAARVAALAGF
jgi:hypothetical protein